MHLSKVLLLFALLACHHVIAQARIRSVEGKVKGTSPRSAYEAMMVKDDYEEGCDCNDTGCDCPEQLNACCRMGFCCGEDYPICCPLVCCPVDYPVCTDGNTCNPYRP